jgi:hypothetical protein
MGKQVWLVAAFSRGAGVVVISAALSTFAFAPIASAESAGVGGIGPALETQPGDGAASKSGFYDADAPVRAHWCNKTSTLIDDIHRLGGYSVMRADIGEGRVLERYWNVSEELVIEHGTDGTSCLVDLRRR